MGKEKVIEKTVEEVANKSNVILQYAPLVLALVSLVVCYLLYKKIQSLSSNTGSLDNIEKQFTGFVKEQSEINTINSKRFNAIISQINQLSYVIQNNNVRPTNTVDTQMSPNRESNNNNNMPIVNENFIDTENNNIPQPPQREMMPTSIIQTNFPMQQPTIAPLETPMNTTSKKELEINQNNFEINKTKQSKQSKESKKVIDIQNMKEEVLIEEASSDDDEE